MRRWAWAWALAVVAAAASAAEERSVYEALEEYNFPAGVLPKGVVGYELDRTTGAFSVSLNGTCTFSVEGSYQLRYRPTVSGRVSKNKLTQLKGVSVRVLLLWLDIVAVSRVGDELDFSVGILSTSFGLDNFLESPQCGCGFDCLSLHMPI
ncbi:uncharacterized protein At5g01610-like [Wolffia australiana]